MNLDISDEAVDVWICFIATADHIFGLQEDSLSFEMNRCQTSSAAQLLLCAFVSTFYSSAKVQLTRDTTMAESIRYNYCIHVTLILKLCKRCNTHLKFNLTPSNMFAPEKRCRAPAQVCLMDRLSH